MGKIDRTSFEVDGGVDRRELLSEHGLLESPPDVELGRLLKLANRLLGTDLAQVAFVGDGREWIVSSPGEGVEERSDLRPLHSRTVDRSSSPPFLGDFSDPDVVDGDRMTINGEEYQSYAGRPLTLEGTPVGVFCVWDERPREWTEEDRENLGLLTDQAQDLMHRPTGDQPREDRSLTESEKRFRTIINNTQDYFTVLTDEGKIRYESPAIEDVLGFEQEELVGESAFDYIHPDDLDEATRVFEGVLSSGPDSYHRVECRHRDAEGNYVWLEVTASGKYHSVWDGYLLSSRDISDRKRAESELRERESLFRDMADNIDEVFWMHDTETDEVVYVSPAAEEIWGEPPEAFLGSSRGWLNSIVEADRERVSDHFRENFHDEFDVEYRIKRSDGEIRWIHDHGYPVRDEDGTVTRLVGTARDVTDRKRAETELEGTIRELRETTVSRDYLENIIATMPSSVMVVDDDGTIDRVNSALREMLECSREDLIGEPVESVLAEGNETDILSLLEKGESSTVQNRELHYRARDGSTIPVLFSASRLDDSNSGFEGVVCVGLDLSRHKEAQAALEESERRFRQMAENINEVIFMFTGDWSELLYANRKFEDIWNQSIEEVDENPLAFLEGIHPDEQDKAVEAMRKTADGEKQTREYRVNKEEDYRRSVITEAVPIKDEYGDVTRIVGTIREITELKETQEELQRALEEKANLLKEVHHRVKNNMQIISSLISLHEQGEYRRPERMLEECKNRITSMAMIHDMLYRSENLADVSFNEYVEELVSSLIQLNEVPESSVDVSLEVAPSLELSLGQAIPCGLIIHELVSNACQHAFEADRENELRVEMSRSGDRVVLRVRDNGPGFPEDFVPEETGSVGMEILQALSEHELGGTLAFDDEPMTTVEVEFELADVSP